VSVGLSHVPLEDWLRHEGDLLPALRRRQTDLRAPERLLVRRLHIGLGLSRMCEPTLARDFGQELAGTTLGPQPDLGGVVLRFKPQSCLAGIHAGSLGDAPDVNDFIDVACLSQELERSLQTFEWSKLDYGQVARISSFGHQRLA
jgi:hypothetical protein